MPIVFISYSHESEEHRARVLAFAQRLRQDGVDARLDQYLRGAPPRGWQNWMLDQIEEAEYVLLVCTASYYERFRGRERGGSGKGVTFEGHMITTQLWQKYCETTKFLPCLFTRDDSSYIPEPLLAWGSYLLDSEDGYQQLYDFLLGQAGAQLPPLGELKPRPQRQAEPLRFAAAPAAIRPAPAPSPPATASVPDERLLRSVPLGLLLDRQEPLILAPGEDGATRCLAFATGERLVVGRALARQLRSRAGAELQRRGHSRVHWVTHWDDTALNQVSLELGWGSAGGRPILSCENLTGYGSRPAPIEIVEPGGGSHSLLAGERLELADEAGAWVVVLASGSTSQRLLHLELGSVSCGGTAVPFLRSEGTLFWVPPGEPAARRVRFFGLWLPLSAAVLAELLRREGADLKLDFARSPLALTLFADPQAGPMVEGSENLEQALGLA